MAPAAEIVCGTHRALAGFSGSIEELSLQLLRAIESTVDSLGRDERVMRSVLEQAAGFEQLVSSLTNGTKELDPDEVIVGNMTRTLTALRDAIPISLRKRAAIDKDKRLDEAKRELLHSAYETFLDTAAALESALTNLRAAIVRHDMRIDNPITGEYTDAETLIADLHKLRRA